MKSKEKKPKRPCDPNQLAKLVIEIASGEENEIIDQVGEKPRQKPPVEQCHKDQRPSR